MKSKKHNIINKIFNISSEKLPTKIEYSKVILFDDFTNLNSNSMVNTFEIRQIYCMSSFIILNDEWLTDLVEYLKQFKKVIELSCGAGWLTHWIKKYGYNIHSCVDNLSWDQMSYNNWVDNKDSIQHVKDNPDTELFILSWPYMDDVALNIWNTMRENQKLLYIGEGSGGCTANDEFFNNVSKCEIESDTNLLTKNFLSFCGIHDRPCVYKKLI